MHSKLVRTSAVTLKVDHTVPCHIYANQDVQVENNAVTELLNFLSTEDSVPGLFDRVIVTPDFHKGSGIPIGTVANTTAVLPKAVGKDVGCGVRLLQTNIWADDLEPHWTNLMNRLRYIFFEGGRDIPMSPEQRELMLITGCSGLREGCHTNKDTGLWQYYDPEQESENNWWVYHANISRCTSTFLSPFRDYIRGSGQKDGRDAQIGSVGGGNHFVEIQRVDALLDGEAAYKWKLQPRKVAIMVHTGSVSLGHVVELLGSTATKEWPKGVVKPKSGFYPLQDSVHYLSVMQAALHFAECNRLFLGLMVVRALSEVLGHSIQHHLVYDAPHNFIEQNGDHFLHRKGACPAPKNCPVLIPGSMGDSSYVLQGSGNEEAFQSACHGAGRQTSRNKAANVGTTEHLRVVTPVDPDSPSLKSRPDILKEYRKRLAEEAPLAYKPISPIIETLQAAKIATPVARLRPLLTVKG